MPRACRLKEGLFGKMQQVSFHTRGTMSCAVPVLGDVCRGVCAYSRRGWRECGSANIE